MSLKVTTSILIWKQDLAQIISNPLKLPLEDPLLNAIKDWIKFFVWCWFITEQNTSFSSSHVWMWELDYKESWAPKNWSFWTVVLEKTLENLLNNKEIHPVNPKGNQSWIFIGRTDAEAETPILRPPDAKTWLIWKDPDAGKDIRWEEKGMTEDEMVVGWHHWLKGHEFE